MWPKASAEPNITARLLAKDKSVSWIRRDARPGIHELGLQARAGGWWRCLFGLETPQLRRLHHAGAGEAGRLTTQRYLLHSVSSQGWFRNQKPMNLPTLSSTSPRPHLDTSPGACPTLSIPTLGASSELCCSTVYRICMLLGFRALESSLKITNLMVVPRLSLCAFSSSLDTKSQAGE